MQKEDSKNPKYSRKDMASELDDLFDDNESSVKTNITPAGSTKPVSTIVGRAFDIIEQQLIDNASKSLNKNSESENSENSNHPAKEAPVDFRKTVIGKSIDVIKQKMSRSSANVNLESSTKEKEQVKTSKVETNKSSKPESKKIEVTKKDNKAPQKSEKKVAPKYVRESTDDDLFDESGLSDDSDLASLKEEVEDLSSTFKQNLKAVAKNVEIAATKTAAFVLKVGIALIAPINAAFLLVFKRNKKSSNSIEEVTTKKVTGQMETKISESEKAVKKEPAKASFNDMIELNITFTDNYDVAMYKRNTLSLSKAEEALIMLNAVDAIKQCYEFTKDCPPIASGHYQGQNIHEVMLNVTENDIAMYMGYVNSKPKKYIGKSWKISETFATWLINNSPM